MKNITAYHETFIEKQNFFNKLRKIIRYAAGILVFLFSGLQLKQIFAGSSIKIDDTFTLILFKATITCLYSSWVYGLNFDLKDQELAFLKAPNKGKLTTNLIGMIASLIALFAILAFLTELKYIRYFVIALTVFSCMGKAGEYETARFARKSIYENRKEYADSKDFIGELSLKTIEQYIAGKWLWTRFYIGSIILILVNILTFTSLAKLIAAKISIPSENLIKVCSIILYLLVMEIWNWHERINRKIRLSLLKEIKGKYKLIEKK